jgi:hypothetical protein
MRCHVHVENLPAGVMDHEDQLALALEDLEAALAKDEAKDGKADPALKLQRRKSPARAVSSSSIICLTRRS